MRQPVEVGLVGRVRVETRMRPTPVPTSFAASSSEPIRPGSIPDIHVQDRGADRHGERELNNLGSNLEQSRDPVSNGV